MRVEGLRLRVEGSGFTPRPARRPNGPNGRPEARLQSRAALAAARPAWRTPVDFGFRVSGFKFRVSGSGFRVSGFGFRVSGFGFRVSGFGFRVSDFGFRVSDFGFRGSIFPGFGSGSFQVSGFGFWVSSFGFRVSGLVQGSETMAGLTSVMRSTFFWAEKAPVSGRAGDAVCSSLPTPRVEGVGVEI